MGHQVHVREKDKKKIIERIRIKTRLKKPNKIKY
jgi:hypothetical protein